MQIAQQLYETGKITYHRTDSLNLSESSLSATQNFIIKSYGKEYYPGFQRKFKTKGRAQEAHEAIRVTNPEINSEDASFKDKNQQKLYDLIWRRFIASQMTQSIFDSTSLDITASNYTFRATGQILKFDGFLKLYPVKFSEKELPLLNEKDILELVKLNHEQHFTQPPARYNEASLIKALEENGIGRPSTYAPTLSTIQQRNYIEKNEEKKFQPTEIGIIVNEMLVKHFPKIVDINFTAKMEEDLDKIAENKQEWVPVIKEFYKDFEENLEKKYEEVEKKIITQIVEGKICPECKSPVVLRYGRFGKFYACSTFPKCKYTESVTNSDLNLVCPKCKEGKVTEKRTKRKRIFYGCSKWPKCDFAAWDKPTGELCKECNSPLVETKKGEKCSNKECDFKITQ